LARWMKPKELKRSLQAKRLMTVRRVRDVVEALMDAAHMTLMPARARTSLVAARVKNPRDRIRLLFSRRHRTEKRTCQGDAAGHDSLILCKGRPSNRAIATRDLIGNRCSDIDAACADASAASAKSFIYLTDQYLYGIACCSPDTYSANSITFSRCRVV
jgi:hypothetical protein